MEELKRCRKLLAKYDNKYYELFLQIVINADNDDRDAISIFENEINEFYISGIRIRHLSDMPWSIVKEYINNVKQNEMAPYSNLFLAIYSRFSHYAKDYTLSINCWNNMIKTGKINPELLLKIVTLVPEIAMSYSTGLKFFVKNKNNQFNKSLQTSIIRYYLDELLKRNFDTNSDFIKIFVKIDLTSVYYGKIDKVPTSIMLLQKLYKEKIELLNYLEKYHCL